MATDDGISTLASVLFVSMVIADDSAYMQWRGGSLMQSSSLQKKDNDRHNKTSGGDGNNDPFKHIYK